MLKISSLNKIFLIVLSFLLPFSSSCLATFTDVEALLEDYATRLAQRQTSHVEWCDFYGKHVEATPYKLSFEPLGILYDSPLDPPERHPTILFQQWFDNRGGTIAQKTLIKRTESTQSTFTWRVTKGLKATTSVTGTVKIPFLGGMNSTVSGEFNITKEKTFSKQEAQSWELGHELNVAPKTAQKMTWLVEEIEYTLPFLSLIRIAGTYAVQTSKTLLPIKIEEAFKEQALSIKNQGYYVDIRDQSVLFIAEGIFNARQGVDSFIQIQEYPEEEKPPLPGSFQRLDVEAFNEGELEVKLAQAYLNAEEYNPAVKWLRRAAQKDQTEAITTLGWLLLNGKGVIADEKEAFKLFRRAAAQNNQEALHILGWLSLKGQGTEKDELTAFNFFKRAADLGYAQAMNNVGVMLIKGLGVPTNLEEALTWLQKAAQKDSIPACENLCWGLITREAPNTSEALKWNQKAKALSQEQSPDNDPLRELSLRLSYDEALSLLQTRANQQQINAYVALGWMYYHGVGVSQDYKKAHTWYTKAQHSPEALYALGQMAEKGLGAQEDKNQALKYYKLAAEQGHTAAQAKIKSLEKGSRSTVGIKNARGVNAGVPQSIQDLQEAAELGDADALFNLGDMYRNGTGVQQDYKKAIECYRQAAEQGHADAQYDIGVMYDGGLGVAQNYAEALKYYRLSADQGNADALCNLGAMYENAQGVQQDISEAIKCYRQAAEKGQAAAQFNLGRLLMYGRGVHKNYAEALKYYRLSADQGYADALCNLGLMYRMGWGVQQDISEAFKYYKQAAEKGQEVAQYNLGNIYETGLGEIPDNYTEALKYYHLSAAQGYVNAQYRLGYIYYYGGRVLKGVKKNYLEALKYYKLAAAQGHQEAQKAIQKLARKGYV